MDYLVVPTVLPSIGVSCRVPGVIGKQAVPEDQDVLQVPGKALVPDRIWRRHRTDQGHPLEVGMPNQTTAPSKVARDPPARALE